MKKYLLVILTSLMLISSGFTQDTTTITDTSYSEYPKLYIVDNDTLGLIITIEQAQKIDNDYELLKLYEDLSISYQEGDTVYLQVINKLEEQVSVMEVEIEALKSVGIDKDTTISKLKEEIELYNDNNSKFEQELSNRDDIIEQKDVQIKKLKRQKLFGGVGAGAAIVILILLLL